MNKQALTYQDVVDALGGGSTGEIAANTAIVGSAAFLVSAVARAINQSRQNIKDYGGVPMEKQLDTTMKDPVVQADSIHSLVMKKKAHDNYHYKSEYGILDDIRSGAGDLFDAIKAPFNKDFWNGHDLVRWSLPAAAAVALGIAGYKTIDSIYDKSDAAALKKRQKELTDMHKKLVLARALQARDALSPESASELLKGSSKVTSELTRAKTASDNVKGKYWGLSLVGLLITTAAALGAIGGYNYSSARNKNRQKYEAIKSGLGQYARDNAMMRTVDQRLTDDPELEAELQKIKKTKGTSPVETPIEYTPVTI